MSEGNKETERTDHPADQLGAGLVCEKPRTSKWAKVSLYCALFGWGLLVIMLFTVGILPPPHELGGTTSRITRKIILVLSGGSFVLIVAALISGVAGLVVIKLKNQAVTGTGKALVGLVCSLLYIAIPLQIFVFASRKAIILKNDETCGDNILTVGEAVLRYANDHDGKYPTPNKWCDLLVQDGYVAEKFLRCPSGGKARSHYAINPTAESNSPDDMVLLFETKGGWNQYGGPELLTTENHPKSYIKGCQIFFNYGYGGFIRADDLWELMWSTNNSETQEVEKNQAP